MSSSVISPPAGSAGPGVVMGGLAAELAEVVGRISAEAAAGTVLGVRGPELVALTGSLLRSLDAVTAAATHTLERLHLSGVLVHTGYVSTKRWLIDVARLSERDARAALGRAGAMNGDFHSTWVAWNAGQISGAAAREISVGVRHAMRGLPPGAREEQTRIAERTLLAHARVGTLDAVKIAIDTLVVLADPDGASAAAMAAHEDQTLSCVQVGSMAHLTAYLDHQAQATLMTALETIVEGWYRDGSLTPEDQPTPGGQPTTADGVGTDPAAAGTDERKARLRRPHLLALALTELARRQLEHRVLGTRHRQHPHVTLTVDVTDLTDGLGARLRTPGQETPTRIGGDTARRILCTAQVTPVITRNHRPRTPRDHGAVASPTGIPGHPGADLFAGIDLTDWLRPATRTVLYVGRTHRTAPRRLRTALETRDQHCAFPHCRVDTTRCEAHHIHHWEHGGFTDLDNCALLCPQHHHSVHEGGWQMTPTPGTNPGTPGYWTFTPPERPPKP